jgi:alpha-ribazole phosphatase
MSKRLLLLRHAQLGAEYLGRFVGSSDPGLDAIGQAQARAVSGRLARLAPNRCYCSPMQRCRQTAAALAGQRPIQIDDDLREIDFGRWEGGRFEEIRARDPELVGDWAELRPDFAFPEGERLADFLGRVRAAADRLAHDEAETVLAVTHGGVIRAMICHLLGLEPRHYVLFNVGYASLAVIDLFDGGGVLSGLQNPDLLPEAVASDPARAAMPWEVGHG